MDDNASRHSSATVRKYLLLISVIWTALMGTFFIIERNQIRQATEELAVTQANESYEKDVLYRRWATSHGGVYAPVTPKNPPNPYLSDVPERDLTTPSGRRLTLINPAYMTRQVYEIAKESSSVGGHITSLKPIRPENAPAPWEESALKAFEKGATKFHQLVTVDGKPYLRFMRPLIAEKSCLKCHAAQGYKEGEIRGGISILQPMENPIAIQMRKIQSFFLLHGGIWLIGLCALVFGAFILNRRITERRRTEEALRESEEKFRRLVENAPEAIFVQARGIFVYLNQGALRLFGAESAEELQGRPIIDRIHPDDHEIVRERLRLLSEEQKAVPAMEQKYLKMDGSVIDVEVSAVPVTYQNLEGSFSFVHDIRRRKRSELEMTVLAEIGRIIGSTLNIDEVYEQFAAETRKLIPFDRITINLIDHEHRLAKIAYVSGMDISGRLAGDSFPIKGSTNECVVQTLAGRIVQPQNAEEMMRCYPFLSRSFEAGIRSLLSVPLISQKEVIGILHLRAKKPNAYTEQDLRLAERIGAQITGAIVNAQLFNDLQQTEKSLRESERKNKEAQRVAHLGYWIWHIKTNKREWSEEMYRIYGLDKDRSAGDLSKAFLEAVHPDDRHIVERSNLSVIRNKKPISMEYRVIWPDGSIHYICVEAEALILDEQGEADVLTGISLDMTDRKRLEEERLSLETRLNRAEKMEALGQLAGGVAHDLNNVLGILMGYSDLLLTEIPEESRLRRHVNNILMSSQKGAAIIQDLLTLARRGVAVSEVVNLNRIVDDYLQSPEFENLRSQHPDVAFSTNPDKDLLNSHGSSVHLGKTVMNLVSNAVEAIVDRGEVTIRSENRYLDRPIRGYDDIQEGDYVVLTVSDTGKGISPDDLGKIFEPFYTKKVMGRSGTGLGLAVVWGTVKDHHGYIDVQSEEGKGSVFTLYLPATREESTGEKKPASMESYRGRGESILVIDDIKAQGEMAVDMLTKLGYRVNSVCSGEEALTYLQSKRVDLIILDMIMDPGMDGLETYRRIIKIHPGQKAIIVSGFSETALVKEAQALGAGAYVKKPYLQEKIGVAVREELNRKTMDGDHTSGRS